jgi:ribonuclease BN (tRNA processing enzyme)
LKLVILGAGPAYTDRPGAVGAAYLLTSDHSTILLDIGQGAFTALAREMEPSELGAVVVSHLHPDHFIDLVPLRHYLRYEFEPPRRVRVHAPEALAERIDALHGESGFTEAVLDVEPLEPGSREVASFLVEARRVTHTDDSYAFRVTDGSGPGLVYSGDCGVAADLAPLVQPGDVLLAEVSFGPGPVASGALHLDGPGVGDLASSTRPGRVLLTHIQMGFDREATVEAVRERYDGPVDLVDPGERFVI